MLGHWTKKGQLFAPQRFCISLNQSNTQTTKITSLMEHIIAVFKTIKCRVKHPVLLLGHPYYLYLYTKNGTAAVMKEDLLLTVVENWTRKGFCFKRYDKGFNYLYWNKFEVLICFHNIVNVIAQQETGWRLMSLVVLWELLNRHLWRVCSCTNNCK